MEMYQDFWIEAGHRLSLVPAGGRRVELKNLDYYPISFRNG